MSSGFERWHCDVERTAQPDSRTLAAAINPGWCIACEATVRLRHRLGMVVGLILAVASAVATSLGFLLEQHGAVHAGRSGCATRCEATELDLGPRRS
ncbi:MAG: hypothetical protein ACRDPM_24990 [Solirubrobacteraceae bacterium]